MNSETPRRVQDLNVSELKALIKECLRELGEEKGFTETQYKQLWIKPPMITTEGFSCSES